MVVIASCGDAVSGWSSVRYAAMYVVVLYDAGKVKKWGYKSGRDLLKSVAATSGA